MKKNRIIILLIVLLIIVLMITGYGYAKYLNKAESEGSAEVAKLICETSVIPGTLSATDIDPYCTLTVKNFNTNSELTEVAVNYSITVATTDGSTVPDFYCTNSEETQIANSLTGTSQIIGELGCSEQQTNTYTLYFVNVGDSNVTKNITVNTTVTQK